MLAQVAGVAALVDVCGVHSFRLDCPQRAAAGLVGSSAANQPRCLTIAGEAVGAELEALLAAAQEGSVRVVAPLGAGGAHVTFVHIFKSGR